MRPLTRKLVRDLAHLRGQVATLSLVVACGIASYVGLLSTYDSLQASQAAYYARYDFADVFARLERAPEALAARVAALPGVGRVATRVVEEVRLPAQDGHESAVGRVVSLPDAGPPVLNGLHVREGRLPEPGRADEALLLEAFARARALRPGAALQVVMEGRLRTLRVVGVALSPEYVYALKPGSTSDEPGRFAVLWMRRAEVAAAFRQEGSFNDVSLTLEPGASPEAVCADLDRLLAPHGGLGAVARAHQPSHLVLTGELQGLAGMATTVPAIFMAVSAFLAYVVLSRLVALQRPELAALKALGYTNAEVALHFCGLVGVTLVLGMALGVGGGALVAWAMTGLYAQFFRFPVLEVQLTWRALAVGGGLAAVTSAAGALVAVWRAARLPPAEAMRPPAPPLYRRSAVERLHLSRLVGPAGRMVLRDVARQPLRTALSALGVAAAVAVVILGGFRADAFAYLVDDLFVSMRREDLSVTLARPVPARALQELRGIPGVLQVEGARALPARLTHGHRSRDVPLLALPPGAELQRVVTTRGVPIPLPPAGLMLTGLLAQRLGVGPGDVLDVELREGTWRRARVPVVALADEPFGLQAYVAPELLQRLAGEEPSVSVALLRVDPAAEGRVVAALERSPLAVSIDRRQALVDALRAQSGETTNAITLIITAFAMCIAVGVVYNNARIALSQRTRELASLRVLGFTRREISTVMLGDIAVQLGLGLPAGLLLGRWWMDLVMRSVGHPETLRMAVTISDGTYLLAVSVVLATGVASALWVRRLLDRLDLIGVLKTRE